MWLIALTPRSGREAMGRLDRGRESASGARPLSLATPHRSSVGSATMAPSARSPYAEFDHAAVGILLIHRGGREHVAGRRPGLPPLSRKRAPCVIRRETRLGLTGPWARKSLPFSMSGSNGGMVIPVVETVSVCASRARRRSRFLPGRRARDVRSTGEHFLLGHGDVALFEEPLHEGRRSPPWPGPPS